MTASEPSSGAAASEPSSGAAASESSIPAARIVFDPADRAEIAERIDRALQSGALTLGANGREFEAAFGEVVGLPYAAAVSSGTAALEIVLRALDVRGREVIVPADTFAASAFAVLAAGGTPVFADVEADTFALGVDTVAPLLTERTAAVVLVHIGGLVTPRIGALRQLCDGAGVALVEDAAHAHGSTFEGRPAGTFGVAAAFSFYPTKVITSGEGGMVVTGDERLHREALILRDQGKAGFHDNRHVRLGSAWRMSELHAAVGVVHLRHLAAFVAVRRGIAARYDAALPGIPGIRPVLADPACKSNYYKYLALLDDGVDRAALKQRLAAGFGVQLSGEVYDTPLHRQPVFQPWARGALPVADRLCDRHVCLPVHSDMTDAEADRVLDALAEALR